MTVVSYSPGQTLEAASLVGNYGSCIAKDGTDSTMTGPLTVVQSRSGTLTLQAGVPASYSGTWQFADEGFINATTTITGDYPGDTTGWQFYGVQHTGLINGNTSRGGGCFSALLYDEGLVTQGATNANAGEYVAISGQAFKYSPVISNVTTTLSSPSTSIHVSDISQFGTHNIGATVAVGGAYSQHYYTLSSYSPSTGTFETPGTLTFTTSVLVADTEEQPPVNYSPGPTGLAQVRALPNSVYAGTVYPTQLWGLYTVAADSTNEDSGFGGSLSGWEMDVNPLATDNGTSTGYPTRFGIQMTVDTGSAATATGGCPGEIGRMLYIGAFPPYTSVRAGIQVDGYVSRAAIDLRSVGTQTGTIVTTATIGAETVLVSNVLSFTSGANPGTGGGPNVGPPTPSHQATLFIGENIYYQTGYQQIAGSTNGYIFLAAGLVSTDVAAGTMVSSTMSHIALPPLGAISFDQAQLLRIYNDGTQTVFMNGGYDPWLITNLGVFGGTGVTVSGLINTGSVYEVGGVQVVGARQTGWTAGTGTTNVPNKGAINYDTATLAQLAARVFALEQALFNGGTIHGTGIIGP